ncbi:LacI family DNA-binding transcriptional regulator [Rhizobium sp. Leaf341]|uniref:LacI family DNA-binding transcriptional regulator n=1 Tax=Rhizobium sp. Leaf341 TaxID=1736344 RepID=UPI0007149979|nr:LacI family DNA-binding transcriptional regulator [Rhizobium sp. Leaf341]KQR69987.1 hypothetical protein ASG03_04845 [Rhizobium sp. Leaf341]
MATIRDVAKKAGVAISTVSLAMNGTGPVSAETLKRVQDASAAIGYTPNGLAQSLKRGHSKLVGLVLGDIGNPFFSRLLRALETALSETDHMVIVAETAAHPERERNTIEQLRRHRVGGILMAPMMNDPAFALFLRRLDIPVVLIDQNVEGADRDFVSSDNALATMILTEYLRRLGHRRIAFIGGDPVQGTAALRLKGFRETMAAAGLPVDPALEVVADFSGEKAYDHVVRLMSRPQRPTALIAASNLMALGALQAIHDLGLDCPGDVSLTGVDDVPWGNVVRPRLTIAAQPVEELAQRAATFLTERMKLRGCAGLPPRTHIAIPKLVLGTSCAPPRGEGG